MRKGAYSYEHIDNWKNVNKKSRNIITWTENDFYSHLNMKDITDADYIDAKRICKDFEIKKKNGKNHDLYVQSDTLLLADIINIQAWSCKTIFQLLD